MQPVRGQSTTAIHTLTKPTSVGRYSVALENINYLSAGFATELKKPVVSIIPTPSQMLENYAFPTLPRSEKYIKSPYFSFREYIFLFVTTQTSPELQSVVPSNIFLLENPCII